jgi:signal transduction histidine kinase/CheY-like chemotaxis protein
MNGVAERLTGWPLGDAAGRHLDEIFRIINATTRAAVPSPVARVLGSGLVVGLANHTVLVARDGRHTHIADSGAPIRAADGTVVGVVLVFRDVGDEERVRAQAMQQQKLEALGQLAGGVAHDINNVLAAVLAASELLAGRGDDGVRRHATTISTAAQRGAAMVRQLLTFARPGADRQEAVELNRLVQETVALLERLLERRIVLATDLDPVPAMVLGDPAQLQNALINLGVNARDAIAGTGRITISVTRVALGEERAAELGLAAGVHVAVSVTDTGRGIASDVLPRLFEPFFTTKPAGQGTGLGLAAVYGVARAHRGAVTVASELGRGAVFTLFLPQAAIGPTAPVAPVPGWNGRGAVLVVDDDPVVRSAIADLLATTGFQVEQATGGMEAIDRIRAGLVPSLVVLDVDMPAPGGAATCRLLRALHADLPVLFISGWGADAEVERLLAEPATGFLPKPFRLDACGVAIGRLASGLMA